VCCGADLQVGRCHPWAVAGGGRREAGVGRSTRATRGIRAIQLIGRGADLQVGRCETERHGVPHVRPPRRDIAEGTRCAACGQCQALVLWLACGVSAGATALTHGVDAPGAALVAFVILVVLPPALVLTILVYELAHALAATLIGQTVVRVVVGERRPLVRLGPRPEFVFGTVLLGNGATSMLDLPRDGYRIRTCVMLLGAPAVSLGLAAVTWWASADWPQPAYAAGLPSRCATSRWGHHAGADADLWRTGLQRSGERVVRRARTEPQLEELIVHGARDAMAFDVERGDIEAAIDTARADAAGRVDIGHRAQPAGVRAPSGWPTG
jgi:hypothetical protein